MQGAHRHEAQCLLYQIMEQNPDLQKHALVSLLDSSRPSFSASSTPHGRKCSGEIAVYATTMIGGKMGQKYSIFFTLCLALGFNIKKLELPSCNASWIYGISDLR